MEANNSAKLREALRAVKDINDGRPHDAHGYEINDIIEEALAAPVRNCDRFVASRDAQRAWRVEDGGRTAYYEWLYATVNEKEVKDAKG